MSACSPVGDGGAGGVVAGGGDDDVIGGGVEVGQVLAVDAGIGDLRGEVAGRGGSARGCQLLEVGEEVEQGLQELFGCLAAPQFFVTAAEHLLGELEQPGEV
jgi:hypothetical protein